MRRRSASSCVARPETRSRTRKAGADRSAPLHRATTAPPLSFGSADLRREENPMKSSAAKSLLGGLFSGMSPAGLWAGVSPRIRFHSRLPLPRHLVLSRSPRGCRRSPSARRSLSGPTFWKRPAGSRLESFPAEREGRGGGRSARHFGDGHRRARGACFVQVDLDGEDTTSAWITNPPLPLGTPAHTTRSAGRRSGMYDKSTRMRKPSHPDVQYQR